MSRLIKLSEHGESIANQAGLPPLIADIADKSEDRFVADIFDDEYTGFSAQDVVVEYLGSDFYKSLDYVDKAQAHSAISRLTGYYEDKTFEYSEPQGEWRLLGEESDDALIPAPKELRRLPADNMDGLLLSGAVALDVVKAKPRIIEGYAEHGFKSRLDFAVFIGACTVAEVMSRKASLLNGYDSWTGFSFSDGLDELKILLGGTLHGDFRLRQERSFKGKAVSPIGTEVEFSPVEYLTPGTYHSSEPSLLSAIMRQVNVRAGKQATLEMCRNILEELNNDPEINNPAMGNFGDWGDHDIRDALFEHKLSLMGAGIYGMGDTADALMLEDTLVDPNNHDIRFQMVGLSDRIRMHLADRRTDCTWESIEIPNEYLPAFAKALVEQTATGLGRTSPTVMLAILQETPKLLA
jgi:hypothetical protein